MVAATGLALLTAGCTSSSNNPKLRLEASVSTAPSNPFTLDVETRNSEITNEEAGNLAVTYHNASDDSAILNLGQEEPHPRPSEAESPGIVLEDSQANIEKDQACCWMPAVDSVSSTLGRPQHETQPDEKVHTEYQVWAHPKGKPEHTSLEPGTYQVPMPESAALEIVLTEPQDY